MEVFSGPCDFEASSLGLPSAVPSSFSLFAVVEASGWRPGRAHCGVGLVPKAPDRPKTMVFPMVFAHFPFFFYLHFWRHPVGILGPGCVLLSFLGLYSGSSWALSRTAWPPGTSYLLIFFGTRFWTHF